MSWKHYNYKKKAISNLLIKLKLKFSITELEDLAVYYEDIKEALLCDIDKYYEDKKNLHNKAIKIK